MNATLENTVPSFILVRGGRTRGRIISTAGSTTYQSRTLRAEAVAAAVVAVRVVGVEVLGALGGVE